MAKFSHHIFVCTNTRPAGDPRGCCSEKGSEHIRALFKAEIKKRGLKGIVRANAAGCLDQCQFGPTVVVYPQATWYGGVTEKDVPLILDALKQNKIVDRLVIPDEALSGQSTDSEKKL